MHWNLTWIDYSHALMMWEGFWTQIWPHTHFIPSSINHLNHKPSFYFKVHKLVDASFKFSLFFLHFSFRFYINVYTMYLCYSCDEKSLFFIDCLINTIKILEVGNDNMLMGTTLKFFQTVSVCIEIYMDRLFACLIDMGGFLNSNLSNTPTFFHHQFIM